MRTDGVIVTNYHVIQEGNVAVVKLSDGTALTVDGVLAADKVRDLAIIKIHGKTFRTLTLGNSDRVQVGEDVVAIGNPLGLELTVSNGILSGVRTAEKEGGKFLQITAPISHGSSGGPLFNMQGEVVGITSMYFEGGENLNFAIPVNDAKRLLLNESSKLQHLPNEPEEAPSTASKTHEAPASQQTCNKQAEKFAGYKHEDFSKDVTFPLESGYTNHYDAEASRCYVEMVADYGAGKNFKPSTPGSWNTGRIYLIYDASFEGDGGPTYGEFDQTEDKESCSIQPTGRPNIRCRSEEEFNELALKYFGVTQPTSTTLVIPRYLRKDMSWPSTARIAAEATGRLQQNPEEVRKDMEYCYHNPGESLYFPSVTSNILDGVIKSCNDVNNTMEAWGKACRAAQQLTYSCEGFLKNMDDLKAGL